MIIQKKEQGDVESSFNYFSQFDVKKNANILDIGCSYGSLIYNIFRKGYKRVYGLDVFSDYIKSGKKNYKKISGRIKTYNGKNLPFKDNSFDVILMFDVIEHIPDISRFLKEEVYRVLKKDALFIFQTPNKLTNIPWEVVKNKSFTSYKRYHCSLQTKSSLKRLLFNAGFTSINIEKNNVLSRHNMNKVKNKLGYFGVLMLYLSQVMPMSLYPNLWGSCKK